MKKEKTIGYTKNIIIFIQNINKIDFYNSISIVSLEEGTSVVERSFSDSMVK